MQLNLSKIKADFDSVISYSQNIPEPQTQDLFITWEKSKKYFIDKWGGPIYQYPEKITLHLSDKERHERIENFCYHIDNIYGYSDLNNFIREQEDGFFDNIVIKDYTYDDKVIKKGSKLVRAFKHFISNERCLEDIQNLASQCIQEDKIEGMLCFSVHPLDFLSVSENQHNWRSCHALDGEYRAGNLSYMIDKTTFIAYLKSDNEVKLPNFPEDVPWNSKKWRVLLYLSEDGQMIFAGKQYPFSTTTGMEEVLNILRETRFISGHWVDWCHKYISHAKMTDFIEFKYPKYLPLPTGLKPLEEVVMDVDGSRHFNDVLRSSSYTKPLYTFAYEKGFWGGNYAINDNPRFPIGGKVNCLCCNEVPIMDAADTMMCLECEEKYGTGANDQFAYCECCGSRHWIEDLYYDADGCYICEHCYDNYYHRCDNCGEIVHNDYITYDAENDRYLCGDCYQRLRDQEKKKDKPYIDKGEFFEKVFDGLTGNMSIFDTFGIDLANDDDLPF